MKKVLLEAVLVAVIGGTLAFFANAISPRGLKLTQDYFPGAARPRPSLAPSTNRVHAASGTNVTSPWEILRARLAEKGLTLADSNQVTQLFHDPRYEQELIVFVDARDDQSYKKGHIPGAYQFDYHYFEKYLPTLLPACQAAQQILVYCNGGDCEDSEFAATMLRDAGIPKEKLFVYGGGITEWTNTNLPLEAGVRKSGILNNGKQ